MIAFNMTAILIVLLIVVPIILIIKVDIFRKSIAKYFSKDE